MFLIDKPNRSDHDRNEAGIKSEGEDDSQAGGTVKGKGGLGRTPNHLTLR